MAFANAFLGVCHSMAHKLGGTHHVPHGLANALLISHVIRYNATGEYNTLLALQCVNCREGIQPKSESQHDVAGQQRQESSSVLQAMGCGSSLCTQQ